MEVIQDQQLTSILNDGTTWRVGCGDKIKFWEDSWIENGEALKTKYPRLYSISLQQHKLIQQVGNFNESSWEWNLSWRRALFDSEIASAAGFLEDISQITIQRHISDSWSWEAEPNRCYSTRSAYNMLQESSMDARLDEALQTLWKLKIPSKAAIFAWRLIKDRLPTKDNLTRRHIEINDSLCPFCRSQQEDAAHLFFNCPKSLALWWESLAWSGSVGALPINPRSHFLQHQIGMNGGQRNNRWQCWWVALTWSMWQHRNKILFSNKSFNASKLMDDALFVLWSWLRASETDFNIHYNYWSTNLSICFSVD